VKLEQLSFKLKDIPQLAGVKIAEGAVTDIHVPYTSSDHSKQLRTILRKRRNAESNLRASGSSQI